MTETTFRPLPLSEIRESPTNPRRSHPPLDELVDSIRELGVLEPVMVRPVNGHHELVFGHRRFRAAREVGLAEIPAMVREMDDLQVLEAQLVENLQRADVHPLEEADGFERLMRERKYSAEDMAARLGKSTGYVYGRLKLRALCEEGREAFFADKLKASIALLIARIPVDDLQREAIDRLTTAEYTTASARAFIEREYMLELGSAPFDTTREDLVEDAGACGACPLRTGNQPHLFGDVENTDVCTSPPCFKGKANAAWAERKSLARAAGKKVLSVKETNETLSWGGVPTHGSPYAVLEQRCDKDPDWRTWAKVLPKAHRPEPDAIARSDRGQVVELYSKKSLREAAKKAGITFKQPRTSSGLSQPEKDRQKSRRDAADLAIARIVAATENAFPPPPDSLGLLRAMARAAVERAWTETSKAVAKRRDLTKKASESIPSLRSYIDQADERQLLGLLVEVLAAHNAVIPHRSDAYGSVLKEFAELFTVSLPDLELAALARIKEAHRAKKPAKKASKKPSPKRSKAPREKKAKKPRKNPWASLTPEQRLARVNAIRVGRGLPPKKALDEKPEADA